MMSNYTHTHTYTHTYIHTQHTGMQGLTFIAPQNSRLHRPASVWCVHGERYGCPVCLCVHVCLGACACHSHHPVFFVPAPARVCVCV